MRKFVGNKGNERGSDKWQSRHPVLLRHPGLVNNYLSNLAGPNSAEKALSVGPESLEMYEIISFKSGRK